MTDERAYVDILAGVPRDDDVHIAMTRFAWSLDQTHFEKHPEHDRYLRRAIAHEFCAMVEQCSEDQDTWVEVLRFPGDLWFRRLLPEPRPS